MTSWGTVSPSKRTLLHRVSTLYKLHKSPLWQSVSNASVSHSSQPPQVMSAVILSAQYIGTINWLQIHPKSCLKADSRRCESRNSLLLCSPEAHFRLHISPRLDPILSSIIQSTNFYPTTARKIRYKIILPSISTPKGVTWGSPHCRSFKITIRYTILDRTHLGKWSARRRHLYLTTLNTRKRQTSMPPAGLELAIPSRERAQTNVLDGAANWIG